MFITPVLAFIVVIALCFVYCWGHANGYREACRKSWKYLRSKDINILYPL